MQNTTSINEKILKLEQWLVDNPTHPDYTIVLKDKNQLKLKLLHNV